MKHVIIGTAGHIDHGKTELVKALTGKDCDRFPEEKARGITIDIGFANLDFADVKLSFIDVPGHERFVKNMLAGVWGIDCVLLVVAADESVMPQTREHFDILHLLGVKEGLVAVTKTDLVDEEMVELVQLEIQELVQGSFLENAAVLPVSARTGEGLAALKEALADVASRAAARDAEGLFRVYLDRSFTIKGHGTVVTGTVLSGVVVEGDEVALLPDGKYVKVRGIEVHGVKATEARAGQRAALNLQGLEVADASRGDQLLARGTYTPSYLLDVRLNLLPSAQRVLRTSERIRFHHGTSEILGRVKILGSEHLQPGGTCLAQLRLEAPTLCFPRDRFVIRRYSPMITIGGGIILDGAPAKIRGAGRAEASRMEKLEHGDLGARIVILCERAGPRGVTVHDIMSQCGVLKNDVEKAVEGETAKGTILKAAPDPARYFAASAFRAVSDRCRSILEAFHTANPLRWGMSREELREKVFGRNPAQSSRFFMDRLQETGVIELRGEEAKLSGHEIRLSDEERSIMDILEKEVERGGMNPRSFDEIVASRRLSAGPAKRIHELLQRSGRIVSLGGGIALHESQMHKLRRMLMEMKARSPRISVGQFKEATGTTRKFAIPLLEYLDRERWTRREPSGDRLILLSDQAPE